MFIFRQVKAVLIIFFVCLSACSSSPERKKTKSNSYATQSQNGSNVNPQQASQFDQSANQNAQAGNSAMETGGEGETEKETEEDDTDPKVYNKSYLRCAGGPEGDTEKEITCAFFADDKTTDSHLELGKAAISFSLIDKGSSEMTELEAENDNGVFKVTVAKDVNFNNFDIIGRIMSGIDIYSKIGRYQNKLDYFDNL